MSDLTATAGTETRRSMICIWMAVSAVWVAFWLLMASVAVIAVRIDNPFEEDLGAFSAIVLTPPLALFLFGLVLWLIFDALTRRRSRRGG